MHSPADFVTWALDPARTIEEAYFIERLVEVGVKLWEGKHPDPTRRVESFDIRYRRERRLKERRRLNPAHRVRPRPAEVEQTAEMLPQFAALKPLLAESHKYAHNCAGLTAIGDINHLQRLG